MLSKQLFLFQRGPVQQSRGAPGGCSADAKVATLQVTAPGRLMIHLWENVLFTHMVHIGKENWDKRDNVVYPGGSVPS